MLYKFIFILCILIILYFSIFYKTKHDLENYTPLSNLFKMANTAQTDLIDTLNMDIIQYPDIANAVNSLPDHGSTLVDSINKVKTNYATALNDVNNFIPPTTLAPSTTTTTTTLAPTTTTLAPTTTTTTTQVPLKKYKITGNSINKANSIDISVNTSEQKLNGGYTGIEACERQCDIAGYNCTGFSFNKTNNTCTLYSRLDSVVNDPTGKNDIYYKDGTTISTQPDISQYQKPIKNMTGLAGWMVGKDGNPVKTNNSINDPNIARGFTGSDSCKYVCNNVDNCAGFVFDNNSKTCTLYSNFNAVASDPTNKNDLYSKSGTKVINDKVYTSGNINIDYPNNDIGNIITNVPHAISCQVKCNELDNCDAFVYNSNKKECKLKTSLKYGQPAPGYQAFYDNKGKPANKPNLSVYNITGNALNIANRLDNITVNTTNLSKNDGYTGYEACERQCDIAGNTCAGFSFDKTANTCNLYSNFKTVINDTTGNNDLYSKSWVKMVYDKGYTSGNVNIDYPTNDIGNVITNVPDAISCQIKCNELDNCDAFVYNNITKECNLKTDLNYGKPKTGVQSYYSGNVKPKNNPILGSYNITGNSINIANSLNNVIDTNNRIKNDGYNGIDACKRNCDISGDLCVGFVFNNSTNNCKLYSKLDSIVSNSNNNDIYAKNGKNIFFQPNIDNYQSPIKNKLKLDNKLSDATNISNPNLNNGYTDISACKLQCNKNNDCAGFVFDKSKMSCSLHSNLQYQLNDKTNNSDIYPKNGTEISDYVSPPSINTNYNLVSNTNHKWNSLGGGINANFSNRINNNNYYDIDACKYNCDNNNDCVGFVFNKYDKGCQMYNKLSTGYNDSNYDTYYKKGNSFNDKNYDNHDGFKFDGNNIGTYSNIDYYYDCQILCNENNNCVGYSFDNSKKICYLKNSISNASVWGDQNNYMSRIVKGTISPDGEIQLFTKNNGEKSCRSYCRGTNEMGNKWPYAGTCTGDFCDTYSSTPTTCSCRQQYGLVWDPNQYLNDRYFLPNFTKFNTLRTPNNNAVSTRGDDSGFSIRIQNYTGSDSDYFEYDPTKKTLRNKRTNKCLAVSSYMSDSYWSQGYASSGVSVQHCDETNYFNSWTYDPLNKTLSVAGKCLTYSSDSDKTDLNIRHCGNQYQQFYLYK